MSAPDATRFRLAPSHTLALLIVVAHGAAAAALLSVAKGTLAGWALAGLVVALGVASAWDRALLRTAGSVRALILEGPDSIELELSDGRRLRARVGAQRWVGARLVILALSAPRRRTLLIAGNMLDAEPFRRLRLWALWGALSGVASMPRETVS